MECKTIENLDRQGRVHEVTRREERSGEIAREYAREPKGTLVISPDNESRRELNALIRWEMQERGEVGQEEYKVRVLDPRQEMTGADRQWAGQYEPGDVVRYSRGSKVLGIASGEYVRVESVDAKENRITIEREKGEHQSTIRAGCQGWRCMTKLSERSHKETGYSSPLRRRSCTFPIVSWAPSRKLMRPVMWQSASTQAAMFSSTCASIPISTTVTRSLAHSSQGQTDERVLIHVDTEKSAQLVNSRLAYVSVSRGQYDAQIYTNDRSELARDLSRYVSQRTATEVQQQEPEAVSAREEAHQREQTHVLEIGLG